MKNTIMTLVVFTALSINAMQTSLVEKASMAVTNNISREEVIQLIKETGNVIQSSDKALNWGNQIAIALKGCVSALNDGVTATTDQLYRFTESSVGKITVAILVYKIIGKEILRMLAAFVLMWVVIRLFIKGMKYLFSQITTTSDGVTTTTSRLDDMNSGYGNNGTALAIAASILFVITIGILIAVAFA